MAATKAHCNTLFTITEWNYVVKSHKAVIYCFLYESVAPVHFY